MWKCGSTNTRVRVCSHTYTVQVTWNLYVSKKYTRVISARHASGEALLFEYKCSWTRGLEYLTNRRRTLKHFRGCDALVLHAELAFRTLFCYTYVALLHRM